MTPRDKIARNSGAMTENTATTGHRQQPANTNSHQQTTTGTDNNQQQEATKTYKQPQKHPLTTYQQPTKTAKNWQ